MFSCCCCSLFKKRREYKPLFETFIEQEELKVGDEVVVTPAGANASFRGRVTSALENERYVVKLCQHPKANISLSLKKKKNHKNFDDEANNVPPPPTSKMFQKKKTKKKDGMPEETEGTFGYGDVLKPQVQSAKDMRKALRQLEKIDVTNLLLGGRDERAIKVFECLCKVLCDTYDTVLSAYSEEEEYTLHRGTFTARIISFNVLEFLHTPQFRWKVKCIFCSEIMRIDTVYKNRITQFRTRNDIQRYIYFGFSAVITYCDYCRRKIYESEFELKCHKTHDMCLNCFSAMVQEHCNFHSLLGDLLQTVLNDDCIFEIACFVKGYLVNFFCLSFFLCVLHLSQQEAPRDWKQKGDNIYNKIWSIWSFLVKSIVIKQHEENAFYITPMKTTRSTVYDTCAHCASASMTISFMAKQTFVFRTFLSFDGILLHFTVD
ncbi:hypothetical protein RFI_19245 [Reticulomyxa filosa]|uniref:Uncharacterized protein n=1 Tax=Reticulomyxa filosa TaxID=46433 RepID=X6MY90_RETFI|nr:hypothetical protein RFI_19245 [Reticulomyxa filosa]|eukprot:ETO18050.1 hypothetical protein RFI_19245 [Reticulomyxa filosa]